MLVVPLQKLLAPVEGGDLLFVLAKLLLQLAQLALAGEQAVARPVVLLLQAVDPLPDVADVQVVLVRCGQIALGFLLRRE